LRLAKASKRFFSLEACKGLQEILNIRAAHWANRVRPQRWAKNPPGKKERRRKKYY